LSAHSFSSPVWQSQFFFSSHFERRKTKNKTENPMHTKNSVQTSAPKTTLKVDNLRHLSDHGLAVVFTDRKLSSLVEFIASRDGKTELSAGKSSLEITKLGNVTMTRLHLATSGSGYWHETMHYADAVAGLSYKIKRQGGKGEQDAFDTLRGVIFGAHTTSETNRYDQKDQTLPPIWFPKFGADSDKLREWLKKFAWTLTGAHGLRAQAEQKISADRKEAVRSAKNSLEYLERELERTKSETPETFRDSHERARVQAAEKLAIAAGRIAQAEKDLAQTKFFETSANAAEQIAEISQRYGARFSQGTWNSEMRNYTDKILHFSETRETISPEIRSPNYVAKIGADGETVSLSSGIACSFRRSEIVAWLKGLKNPPQTRYGEVEKFHTATQDAKPRVLLRCGCHLVDASSIDAELASLLVPTHTVTKVPASPRVDLGQEGFLTRLAENINSRLLAERESRAQTCRLFAEKRHALTERENQLPARIEEQAKKVEESKAALVAVETIAATNPKFTGADCVSNAFAALSVINSQHVNFSL
jgi:hypothetical protein